LFINLVSETNTKQVICKWHQGYKQAAFNVFEFYFNVWYGMHSSFSAHFSRYLFF